MGDFAFNAHSGLRYLVLLAGTLAALYALFGFIRKTPVDKPGMMLLRIFAVLLDIQVVLGILTLLTRPFYSALIGHLVLMIGAVAISHLAAVRLKRAPVEQRGWGLLLAASLIPLALIIGGILAIQRPII